MLSFLGCRLLTGATRTIFGITLSLGLGYFELPLSTRREDEYVVLGGQAAAVFRGDHALHISVLDSERGVIVVTRTIEHALVFETAEDGSLEVESLLAPLVAEVMSGHVGELGLVESPLAVPEVVDVDTAAVTEEHI